MPSCIAIATATAITISVMLHVKSKLQDSSEWVLSRLALTSIESCEADGAGEQIRTDPPLLR